MKEIEDLGVEIEREWRAVDYHEDAFAPIAQFALAERSLCETISVERIFRWFLSAPQIPHQPPNPSFGEPPIQLYSGRRFYIEVLFWTDSTTAIHQHSFSGAFQVLLGGSLHTPYTFRRTEAVTRDLLLGSLSVGRSEILRAGDVRTIVSGARFIHSLFHLERPSVTLVVRTKYDTGTEPQYTYLQPGIAYDPFTPDERAVRLLRLLDVLNPRSSDTTALIAEVARTADLGTVTATLIHWFRMHAVPPDTAETLLRIVEQRHGRLASCLRDALQEVRRQALITCRRRVNHCAEHRFLLALLLNVGNRERILELVVQQYPCVDPVDRIVAWVEEIVTASAADTGGASPGEYDLGDTELQVLRGLLHQRTPEQIIVALHEEYDDVEGQRPELLYLCDSLTGSALFRPLFRSSQ